jgi:Fic family protein
MPKPKQATEAELQAIEDVLLRHEEGLSLAELKSRLPKALSARTLARRLAELQKSGRVRRRGGGPATRYVHSTAPSGPDRPLSDSLVAVEFEIPEGRVAIPFSTVARDVLDYVSQPEAMRRPCTYVRRFLDNYVPNETAYIPDSVKVRLHDMGRPIVAERAGGTFVKDILNRFLIDLSWSSSRLEGNTYSRLETERLLQLGETPDGKDIKETQMILNHKAAIEMLVDGGEEVGINRYTLLNLHAALSDNLMADPEASGRLRRRPVQISGSVYTPLAIPQVMEEMITQITTKASAIGDPFERAFFVMVHLPYLQPFEDVNKRVSRLAANIPLIQADLCPLSFVDVPESAYIKATLGVYEMTRTELLRDLFVWAYERSCRRYVAIRDSIAEPDLFRLKYRGALTDVMGGIVRGRHRPTDETIRAAAAELVAAADLDRFVKLVAREFARLDEGNIARYRIRLPDFRDWRAGTRQ